MYEQVGAPARAAEWQPIETAKEGQDVLVVVDIDGRHVVGEARLHEDGWYWANLSSGDYHASQIFPRLWRLLPEPPREGR